MYVVLFFVLFLGCWVIDALLMLFFGQVIKESGELALSWVKMHAYDLCITNSRAQDPLKVPDPIDIHLHLPAGAQKKDGPSAGVAMVRFGFFFLSFE